MTYYDEGCDVGGLADSKVTAATWDARPAPSPICPKMQVDPSPCDCGFLGEWHRRWVYIWNAVPGHKRTDRAIRAAIARGLPPRPGDNGWWVIGGWDERCPGCGDIERFDMAGTEVARFAEQAKVIVFMDARRRA